MITTEIPIATKSHAIAVVGDLSCRKAITLTKGHSSVPRPQRVDSLRIKN